MITLPVNAKSTSHRWRFGERSRRRPAIFWRRMRVVVHRSRAGRSRSGPQRHRNADGRRTRPARLPRLAACRRHVPPRRRTEAGAHGSQPRRLAVATHLACCACRLDRPSSRCSGCQHRRFRPDPLRWRHPQLGPGVRLAWHCSARCRIARRSGDAGDWSGAGGTHRPAQRVRRGENRGPLRVRSACSGRADAARQRHPATRQRLA